MTDDPFHFTHIELRHIHYAIHDWKSKIEIMLKRTRLTPALRLHYEDLLKYATRIDQRLSNELGSITIYPPTEHPLERNKRKEG